MLNFGYLKKITDDKTQKSVICNSDTTLIDALEKIIINLKNNILNMFSKWELANFIKSLNHYINSKGFQNTEHFHRGEIVLVDFGINSGTELCYEHPCVVIENEYRNILVVPTSTSVKTTDKKGKVYDCYIPVTIDDGFDRNTTILLNSSKWISKSRVLNREGSVEVECFKKIYNTLFEFTFRLKKEDIKNLEGIKRRQIEQIKILTEQNIDLLTKIQEISREKQII